MGPLENHPVFLIVRVCAFRVVCRCKPPSNPVPLRIFPVHPPPHSVLKGKGKPTRQSCGMLIDHLDNSLLELSSHPGSACRIEDLNAGDTRERTCNIHAN